MLADESKRLVLRLEPFCPDRKADYDPLEDDMAWYASVEATLPATGQYVVCIHSHENMTVGAYELMLTSQ